MTWAGHVTMVINAKKTFRKYKSNLYTTFDGIRHCSSPNTRDGKYTQTETMAMGSKRCQLQHETQRTTITYPPVR